MVDKVRSKKIFLGVNDTRFVDRRQSSIVTILTDGNEIYSNQYGKMFTSDEIGNFDVVKVGDQGTLEFIPLDGRNEYSYNFISYDTKQGILDYDNYTFGNTVKIETTHSNIGSGSSSILFKIPSSFTSSKLLIELSSDSGKNYEYNEINVVTNGSDIAFSEFGRITLSTNSNLNQIGIGTYSVNLNGSDLDLIFYSDVSETLSGNVIGVSIANTNFNVTESRPLRYADIKSNNISITSSPTPSSAIVASQTLSNNFGYFLVQITDKTNNEVQLSEIVILHNSSDSTLIEYGNVYTQNTLGTFDSNVSSVLDLLFTPLPNINVDITLLQHSASYIEFSSFPNSINFLNAELSTGSSKFQSSDINFKKDFELTHNFNPIFQKAFDGSVEYTSINQVGVDLNKNLIFIPNHFFVSGEKVSYKTVAFSYIDTLTTQTTAVAGIGTNKLSVASVLGLTIDDYFKAGSQGYISITNINSNIVSLASTISSQINSGVAVTFSKQSSSNSEQYSTLGSIGIAQTFIVGVGTTNKLSGDLYVYKADDKFIGVCTSAKDALSEAPKLINLTSVGVGNNHYITATNQNAKAVILIDNVIQSPIVFTSVTSILQNNLTLTDSTTYFSGITSFYAGDLIKIDDEIMKISSVGVGSTNYIEVLRPFMGTGLSTHISNSVITKLIGNYNIIDNKIYFSDAPYGPIYDSVNGDINIRSSFQGRVFMRSGISNLNQETYQNNYVFDDLSQNFNAVTKQYTLLSKNQNITGISTYNSIILVNSIFQNPEDDYNLSEVSSQTKLNFTGTATSALYDPNNANVPRGGIIVSVGSSSGFGYQPLVSAGGTAIVSLAGTIQSISIGNSGSGYRKSIQPIVRVGVQTLSSGTPNIRYIGTATVTNGNIVSIAITNPGTGYTSTNPPKVIFDSPLSYSDLPLIHSTPSSGIGSQAKIDIVVGQGSSVIDFTIKNYGYSYRVGDTLTIDSGGLSGIPTDTTKVFKPFLLKVERIYNDSFSGWSVGELQKLDDISSLFDGNRKKFPISDNGNRFAIIAKKNSSIDLNSVILIFINDVLQEPGVSYNFNGGSYIEFLEAPKAGSKSKIIFYKGTTGVDVVFTDILESIKVGDQLKIRSNDLNLDENDRLVSDIILPDTVNTNPYNSIGVTSDLNLIRPVTWCKQRNDAVIDGVVVDKSRSINEPGIFPVCNIIQSVGIGTTQIFVDSLKTIFDSNAENTTSDIISKVEIIENSNLSGAIGTAIVSIAGTIQSVSINDSGVGYVISPIITIETPMGIGTTGKAMAVSNISAGLVTSVTITSPGFGFTFTNPPLVLIEPPKLKKEFIKNVSYSGDFGIISGIRTTNVGFASTGLIFDLYIPQSYLRNSSVVTPIITQSQIKQDHYFKVSNTTVGFGLTSLRRNGSIIGIGTTGIDNIYQVISVSSASTDVYGVGNTTVTRVTVSVSSYNGLVGLGFSSYYGDYSWGLIETSSVVNQYSVNSNFGVVGLNSTPIIRRYNPLRYTNYNSI